METMLTREAVVPTNDDQVSQFGRFVEEGFRKRQKLWPNPLARALIMGGEALQEALSMTAEQFANTAKLKQMIAAGNFDLVDPDITGERFSVLEAYDPRPLELKLVWPGKDVSIDEARETVGENKGTTSQFLQYLIDDQQAGMDFPISHLASECHNSRGRLCCLCASHRDQQRYLCLPILRFNWYGPGQFFSARELPLAT